MFVSRRKAGNFAGMLFSDIRLGMINYNSEMTTEDFALQCCFIRSYRLQRTVRLKTWHQLGMSRINDTWINSDEWYEGILCFVLFYF